MGVRALDSASHASTRTRGVDRNHRASIDEVDGLIAQAVARGVLASDAVVASMTEHHQCREHCAHGQ